MLWRLTRKILFWLDPELAHFFGALYLRLRGFVTQGRPRVVHGARKRAHIGALSVDSPLGVAAGFDKNGELVLGLRSLGFGFVEVGTVTPRPQAGNPRPRVFRLPEARALINRMGFNSQGAAVVAARLAELRALSAIRFPIGINIGKNRDTPLERAGEDYVSALDQLYGVADYLVVNISSPNTPGLIGLQEGDLLAPLLRGVRAARDAQARRGTGAPKPLFLKLSPDLEQPARKRAVETAVGEGFEGIIASNTSVRRDFSGLAGARAATVAEKGGLSGLPLAEDALRHIAEIRALVGSKITLISVGGLASAEDARRRLDQGADLLQVYTEFVYSGPGFPREIAQGLSSF